MKIDWFVKSSLHLYMTEIHKQYKAKTGKRKIASLKAFFRYLEYEELIDSNPFHTIQSFFKIIYKQKKVMRTEYQKRCLCRDIAVIELLFATGIRISELCCLSLEDIDLEQGSILIYGKGDKERMVQIGNEEVFTALLTYKQMFISEIETCGYFFVNRRKQRLSEQSVRFMINKYVDLASIDLHITPHMFRHSYCQWYFMSCFWH